ASERWGGLDEDVTEYLTFGVGESLTWRAFEAGEARLYEDITAEPAVGRENPKVRGTMLLPIGDAGMFLVGSTAVDAFDETDLDFASVLAASAAAAFDRTDRETTLREREVELARQNRRLERFASVVSHDLRNPLTIARGRLALAREGEDGQLDAVDDALGRIESIVEDVLALARDHGAIDAEPVDLAACAREAWAGVETDGATLAIENSTTIRADRSRLRQVFENLFRNSVEHSSTSSRPQADDSAEGGPTENSVSVRVGTVESGFYVADDGPGIPPEQRESVFEYGRSGSGGSGLGLAIVEEIVRAHGWEISIADDEIGGARFEIATEPSD
ncbi:MAG: HAMP domain-containing sensor histidine kinase, partial [Halalkalicoccus sp.]